ncbi:DNA-processing protein DprA [Saccharothrix longispora]|uniref:DNA-processing protein DprA n=1 Tax=Saccharothrix longispora TaxID=33920 RepID=UPI0028FDA305|nr:DNA-processing protein DprA [Saccharothrix longispora]MDU0292753.1 DNA-processing protein DprA [Saccharothrix longispora]
MATRREQAALLLALRTGARSWADVAAAVEGAQSALAVLDALLTPSQPALDHTGFDHESALDGIEREIADWATEGIDLVTLLDDAYPVRLLMVHQRPPFLTVRGELTAADDRAVAVVGSRDAGPRGLHIARGIAKTLVDRGVTVLSGLASGIDTAAHRAALDAGGRTVAVVGTGLRNCYPAANGGLQDEIARRGAVISQFWPDTGPAKHHFPMRNAVMSGCAVATVVVEAGEHSGTRIQARLALEHGRHVFLLPEVAKGTTWGKQLSHRPNTTVLEGPDHLVEVLDELTAEVPELIDI